mmetsp:Transcript_36073/g.66533  ORF Transcript_36073/g.66533 Transcript_36073/m.66533 type:complete len:201 (+) Transcript_36073:987-1589(+)
MMILRSRPQVRDRAERRCDDDLRGSNVVVVGRGGCGRGAALPPKLSRIVIVAVAHAVAILAVVVAATASSHRCFFLLFCLFLELRTATAAAAAYMRCLVLRRERIPMRLQLFSCGLHGAPSTALGRVHAGRAGKGRKERRRHFNRRHRPRQAQSRKGIPNATKAQRRLAGVVRSEALGLGLGLGIGGGTHSLVPSAVILS